MKEKYKYYLFIFMFILLFLLQLSYFFLLNDIIFNAKKEKYYKLYVYINLLKIILPKIVKFVFTKKENKIPEEFILKIEEIFRLWRDKWEIVDNKFFQGLFIYLFNYDSNNKIEKFYSDFIKEES